MQPGTQDGIWAGDISMVDSIIDSVLGNPRARMGSPREDVNSEKRTDLRTQEAVTFKGQIENEVPVKETNRK